MLTGFLGAGKTSYLGRLLAAPHGRRIGVILNELGQAGVDDVPGATRRATVELGNGCVCCVRSADLIAALADMQARGDVDWVIVETTGLADPLVITWTLARPDVAKLARLDAVVVVVDALGPPAGPDGARPAEWDAQVRCADLVVLAKLDVAPPGALAATLRLLEEAGGSTRVLDGRDPPPVSLLLDLAANAPTGDGAGADPAAAARRAAAAASPSAPTAQHSHFHAVSLSWPSTGPSAAAFSSDAVEDLVESLPPSIFRAKGIVHLGANRWARFHSVGGRLDFDPSVPAPPHGETRLVFLGPDPDEASLREAWLGTVLHR